MQILAIDPGPSESAFVVLEDGQVKLAKKVSNEAMLAFLGQWQAARSTIAIEMIASYGMPVGREVFETCVMIGRFIERASERVSYDDIRMVYRLECKIHLCHSAKAKDANIRQALIDKMGAPGTKKTPGPTYGVTGDCWAALAVAVTAAETPAK